MIKFFRNRKSSIHSVVLPDFGWAKQKDEKSLIQWVNPDKTIAISLNYFSVEPDLPSLKNIDTVRDFFRKQIAQHNGGLIQVDLTNLSGYKAIQTIFKLPQQPTGMVYLASFTIPFKTCSYVVKIQAPEIGTTGMRDSAVVDRLLDEGKISFKENGMEDWSSDPYDKSYGLGALMNKSEEVKYDSDFENHPLSIARKLMSEIAQKIEFKSELGKLNRFEK